MPPSQLRAKPAGEKQYAQRLPDDRPDKILNDIKVGRAPGPIHPVVRLIDDRNFGSISC